MKIGYACVSPHEQTFDLQSDTFRRTGCEPDHLYTDQASGSSPGLCAALAYARSGDQLVIWWLDRLGRSLKDLIEQMANLEQKGVEIVSLQESIDMSTPAGKELFQICGVFAEFERNLMSERTKAGRKPKVTSAQLDRAAELMRERQLTVREIDRLVGLAPNTLYRYLTADGKRRGGTLTLADAE